MFTQTRIALALVATFSVAGASTAFADDKPRVDMPSNTGAVAGDKQRDMQSNTSTSQSSAEHDAGAAGAQNGQPGQAGTTPGQSGVTPGDQRQQQSRPADMDGPTADDAAAGSDSTRKD